MAENEIVKWPTGELDFRKGCLIMGILNVTPDSFSDGGKFFDKDAAVAHGVEMARQGAVIIDVGPESSRPGSARISTDEQISRAIPVIEELSSQVDAAVSIDTYNPKVAETALNAGAAMINDITALADEKMCRLAAEREVPVVLMHMQGNPESMQVEPVYRDVVTEVLEFLAERAEKAERFGVKRERIFIDPGIGFGKTTLHNLLLLRNLAMFVDSGYRVVLGTSRKRFIGEITGKSEPGERIFGTAATIALAAAIGVDVVRVHDVGEMADVIKVCSELNL